ncbi:hypothetical protein B0T16DRAFT_408167 [Cercophora newfieldiana]|uniref:Uncharacterized protein n=1 Tax=Cercophora newfieldiana TaxID=92897 RepID=A0AA39Y9A1_9PEZI|nr:hypothetical protein B0T16DRAFT_408167 [Cercophora newfieldiana]
MVATGMIQQHTSLQLHTILRATSCTTCPAYGPFLFLPTCERCCWQCFRGFAPSRFSLGKPLAVDGIADIQTKEKANASKPVQRLPGNRSGPRSPSMVHVWNGVILLKDPETMEAGDPDGGGFGCRGCIFLRNLARGFLSGQGVSDQELSAVKALEGIGDLTMYALSREEFLRHVVDCPGQKRLPIYSGATRKR